MARVSTAIRASAIADLMSGDQPAIVADRYGIDSATVRVWKQRYVQKSDDRVTDGVTPQPIDKPALLHRQQRIGELILDLFAAKLEASAAIAQAARDPAWLATQSGSELAALGEWLDTTAFAIGDRLAGRGGPTEPRE